MLLEFTLSSQARMPNWLLLRQLYSGGDSGTAPPGNVTVQSLPSIQRSFGKLLFDATLCFCVHAPCVCLLLLGVLTFILTDRIGNRAPNYVLDPSDKLVLLR